ncbi:isochorismate synthase MenF [Erwinia sp. CPCC 100877]|nr:isochorismate synthase MenF [Erwinia sp. CPCC 100877]
MNSLTGALSLLLRQLDGPFPEAPGMRQLYVSVTPEGEPDGLEWLASQWLWPQFYWQQRDGAEELAALGAARRFSCLSDARDFLAAEQGGALLRICGLNAFDAGRGFLFLPRLLWRRRGNEIVFTLTLVSERSLQQDALDAQRFIRRLVAPQPLIAMTGECLEERHLPDREGWRDMTTRALDAIIAGKMEKVVLARVSDLRFARHLSPASLLAASRAVNRGCYHFFMAFDDRSAFLGSSPERLWRRSGLALTTEALAGTVVGDDDDERALRLARWLLNDEKNQYENSLVVEDICQRLEGAASVTKIEQAQIVRLRNVQHLRREIEARLSAPDDALCLRRLQPTAAVAGLPREAARHFIEETEPFDREWYAGSAGWLSVDDSEFCVSLRSASVQGHHLRLYAGAGIVAGSLPDAEWQEIENKAAGLRSLLFSSGR